MTFIETTTEKSLQINTIDQIFSTQEQSESNFFNRIIFLSSIVLVLISLFFIYHTFFQNSEIENNQKDTFSESIYTLENTTVALAVTSESNLDVDHSTSQRTILMDEIKEKDIFQISSLNRDGFYVMVGTFNNYKNAVKLQKMNPTQYTCHIFEPNYNDLNRVGLFISEGDLRKAENALLEIRNMQPKSWLMYNTMN